MCPIVMDPQQELLDETPAERSRRERAEMLKSAGVRPAVGSMLRDDRRSVRPMPLWHRILSRLLA